MATDTDKIGENIKQLR